MASSTPEPSPNTNSSDQLPPLPEPVTANTEDVGGEVRFGKGTLPWWMKYSPYALIAWALWYAFVGGQGLFHSQDATNYIFSGVIIAWAVYHLLAPRFKWPSLPLG